MLNCSTLGSEKPDTSEEEAELGLIDDREGNLLILSAPAGNLSAMSFNYQTSKQTKNEYQEMSRVRNKKIKGDMELDLI